MIAQRTAVVTGIGVLGAAGAGRKPLEAQLRRGNPCLRPIDVTEGYHWPGSARMAALVANEVDFRTWIPPLEGRRMSTPSRFAVVASHLAFEDARLDLPKRDNPALSVALSTAFGPSLWTQRLLDQILMEGPAAASPVLFTESVLNAPAGRVALACRACGPNHTISHAEAGPLLAVARAAADVVANDAEHSLAGTVDEITPILHAILGRFGALAQPDADGVERARPFDRRRNGFLAAEGASVLLLEEETSARSRGATPVARVRSSHAAFDPTAPRVGWGRNPEHLSRQLIRGLDRAGLEPTDMDLIVSGACGGKASDRLEAAVLRTVWDGQTLPPIVAPKAITGEYGGGFLAAAVMLAAGTEMFFPPVEEPDADLEVALPHHPPPTAPARTLVTSLASGGAAAWLVLERP